MTTGARDDPVEVESEHEKNKKDKLYFRGDAIVDSITEFLVSRRKFGKAERVAFVGSSGRKTCTVKPVFVGSTGRKLNYIVNYGSLAFFVDQT